MLQDEQTKGWRGTKKISFKGENLLELHFLYAELDS